MSRISFFLMVLPAVHQSLSTETGSPLVYNELPFDLRSTIRGEQSVKEAHAKLIGCRQQKKPFSPGQSLPEFIHIPKTGGAYVEYIAYTNPFIRNGSKLDLRWGKFADWPCVENYSGRSQRLLLQDDTFRCSKWHRPPHYWWQANESLPMHWPAIARTPYTSRSFCIVRNPYNRLLSQLNFQMLTNRIDKDIVPCVGFNETVWMIKEVLEVQYHKFNNRLVASDCHYLPQSEYVFDTDGCRVCDDILVSEDLTAQLKSLLVEYGLEFKDSALEIKHNVSKCTKVNIMDLPPSTLEMINQRYKDDFINFGYEMVNPRDSQSTEG